jgi:GT2 family glycosyltransferase
MPKIYVILVNYNGYKDTIECVQSIQNMNYENFKILIVDNGSTNDSIIQLKRAVNECFIIESKMNLGFAGGNNLGIKYALENGADYILLLNNDTIVDLNFLNNMIQPFKSNIDIGIVGCKIMYYPEKNIIWYAGGYIDWFRFVGMHFGLKEFDKGQYNDEKEIDFMTGCCMLIKKEVFKKVGLLSNEYFMYFEDVDFCVKVRERGYKIWYNPNAVIYHKVGFSAGGEESSFAIKWCTRNRIIFMNRHKNNVSRIKFFTSKLFFYSTRIIKCIQYDLKGDKERKRAIIEGIKMAK